MFRNYIFKMEISLGTLFAVTLSLSVVNGNVDMTYDFSFDGDQGYWHEVLNTAVDPPTGYINTTMDGECVVQCNRKQIWDIFENFTKYQLWNKNHLLVNMHLKTFDDPASAQTTLLVKGFTFIKGSTKSSYRYLPLGLDHFDKIRNLDPKGDLYVDEGFDRFKLDIQCKITDPCLDTVNQNDAIRLKPNKIKAPFTSAISRTFENTLMAMLIVLRDISPSLSVWEAFSIQTLTSRDEWFDMTCAGHDPGSGRPGVPYEMSRCCNFHLGNVLADADNDEDEEGGSRLSRLKRSIECKKQIGDIHFLVRFSSVIAVVSLLFIAMTVKCFLSRPIPYRPLPQCLFNRPCDPGDIEPKPTAAKNSSAVNGDTEHHLRHNDVTPQKTEEEKDWEMALGDGPNYNRTDIRHRVYIDSDPEFHLDLHLILSYLFLCHIENRALIVVRRAVIIYLQWLLVGLACWVYGTYYPILLDEPIMTLQAKITGEIMTWFFGSNRSATTEFYHHIFILPLIALFGTFGFNLPLLLKKQSVAKTLYSTGELTFFGERFPELLLSKREIKRVAKSSRLKTYEILLWQNMVARLINVFKTPFWKLWWNHWVIGKCNPYTGVSTSQRTVKYILLVFWVPFSVLLVFAHALPFCSIWENYMKERVAICTAEKDNKGRSLNWLQRLLFVFIVLVQIVGIVMIYVMAWDILFLYIQLIVFVSIDLIRHAGEHLPKLILAFAILGYIKGAFWNFADKYRELKMDTMQGLRDMHWEYKEEYYHYNKATYLQLVTPPYEVIWEFNDYGEISIPRRFFYEVVSYYRPYKFYVIRMFVKLGITITVISLLILIMIDFQILEQFSSGGQLLLTLFTVSLPLLVGAVRSPWHRHLSIKRRHLIIRAWAEHICKVIATDKYPQHNEPDSMGKDEEKESPLDSALKEFEAQDKDFGLSYFAAPKATLRNNNSLRYWNPTFNI